MKVPIEEAEHLALVNVKFINFVLEECGKRNKELLDSFGMSYGKLVGIGTVYEEAICSMRKVKNELEGFLKLIREELHAQLIQRMRP